MAQKQKLKPEPESEWVDIPDPTITDNEWEEIPDPTQSASAPFEEQGPPVPQQISEPTDYWGGISKSLFGGEALHTSDESARGWLQGAIGDLPHGLWEGAKMMATSNPIGYAAYHLAGEKMPAEEMGENLIPSLKNVWHLGEESGAHPYEFGRALGQMTGQPAMTEGLFGNVPGLPSGVDIAKVAGRGIETTGRVMKDYAPISDIGTRVALGTVGHSAYGPMGGALGGIYGRAPKFLKGLESAAGGAIERGGQWMRNIDGSMDAAALEDFWGRNTGGEPPDAGGGVGINVEPGPFDRTPFNTPDSEVPELQQFRESTNRNVWDPEETTINETSDPILESPFNESDVEALRQYSNSKGTPVQPSGVNIIDSSDPFSRAPLSEKPHPPEAPEPNVGTGSAFEKYMQAKAQAARAAGNVLGGDEAPMLDIEGNEIPPEVSDVATKAGASINPDMEIKWPKKPTASELKKMTAAGFQFDSATNIFRKFKNLAKEAIKGAGGEEGTFTPQEMLDNLRQLFGKEPTDAQIADAVRREAKPGEPTGAVAPFLTAEERAQRLDDLQNVPQTPEPPRLPRFLEEDPQFAPSGDISTLRSQSVMDSPRTMDPRMAARVEAGGPREFDFTNKDAEIKKFLDSEDTQIADYLKSEDAHPPEATDLNAWKKLKDLGKRLLGDESGEFDPNTLWWNLRRYFDRAPTEAELTRGMQIDPEFKVGDRLQGIKDEIEAEFQAKKPTSTDELMHRYGPKSTTPRLPSALVDAADTLWDQLESGDGAHVGKSLIENIRQHIDEMTDMNLARENRDQLGTMADNAVNDSQRAVFDALYDIADKKYRQLRNPGLESPKPNRAKPFPDKWSEQSTEGYYDPKNDPNLESVLDKFGPKADIPPIDKWDTGPIKPPSDTDPADFYNRPHNPEEHGQPWYWKYGSGMLSNWPPTSLKSIIRDISEADLRARLKKLKPSSSEEFKEVDIIETELQRRKANPPDDDLGDKTPVWQPKKK